MNVKREDSVVVRVLPSDSRTDSTWETLVYGLLALVVLPSVLMLAGVAAGVISYALR
jgi:hypothetical protein